MLTKIENEFLSVTINSNGSELWSIVNKNNSREMLWQGSEKIWPRRSPILFPICGQLKNGQYSLNGCAYNISLHGFARDYEHVIVDKKTDSITFLFEDSEETRKIYPFKFSLFINYSLYCNSLSCNYTVKNNGNDDMPFSIGYHAGFILPLSDNSTANDCKLIFEKPENITQLLTDDSGLLSGKSKQLLQNEREISLYSDIFPGSCIMEGMRSDYIDLVDTKANKSLRIEIKGFPNLVLWINNAERPFICIEPWHGLPDDLNADGTIKNKRGIRMLEKDKAFSCEQKIEVINQIEGKN